MYIGIREFESNFCLSVCLPGVCVCVCVCVRVRVRVCVYYVCTCLCLYIRMCDPTSGVVRVNYIIVSTLNLWVLYYYLSSTLHTITFKPWD